MSMPTFPEAGLDLTREQVCNMLLGSIAMEELALSHIMNAEGEKLQYILGTLPGGSSCCATHRELLEVNRSVTTLLEQVNQSQMLLKNKLAQVLEAMDCRKECPLPESMAACLLTAAPGFCWKQGRRLLWRDGRCGEQGPCWNPDFPAVFSLPPGRGGLLHYTLQCCPGCTGIVSAALQCIRQGVRRELLCSEACACAPGMTVTLTGSVALPPDPPQQAGIYFWTLRKPVSVTLRQATLCLVTL